LQQARLNLRQRIGRQRRRRQVRQDGSTDVLDRVGQPTTMRARQQMRRNRRMLT
jgi:hypothetical protein